MGRRLEVFVRPVSMAEGQRLQRIGRTAKDPVKLRRAIVVLVSAQGQPAPVYFRDLRRSRGSAPALWRVRPAW